MANLLDMALAILDDKLAYYSMNLGCIELFIFAIKNEKILDFQEKNPLLPLKSQNTTIDKIIALMPFFFV